MCIGFKEWSLICDALGRGEQSVILRKGGIAEGRGGFQFDHADFFLFPTLFHEQMESLKLPSETPIPRARGDGQIEIRYRVHVEWVEEIVDLKAAKRLAPFHLWRDEVVAQRFHYDDTRSLSVAFVRVTRLSQPFVFPNSPKYGGCRSWVNLPDPPHGVRYELALGQSEHAELETRIRSVL